MNTKSQTDLSKHVSRVIRSMKRRKSRSETSTAGLSDGTPKATERDPLSSIEVGSSHVDSEGYHAWLEQL